MNQRKEDVKPGDVSFEDTADRHDRSIRQRAFDAFDQGERPLAFSQRMGCAPGTAYTYHDQWKKARGLPQGKAGPPEEEPWDPFEAIATALEEIAVRTCIPFEVLAQNFIKSLDRTGEITREMAMTLKARQRRRAAAILDRIVTQTTLVWALKLPPEVALSALKNDGIDFRRFRFTAK